MPVMWRDVESSLGGGAHEVEATAGRVHLLPRIWYVGHCAGRSRSGRNSEPSGSGRSGPLKAPSRAGTVGAESESDSQIVRVTRPSGRTPS